MNNEPVVANKIPSENEIAELERRLLRMKAQRSEVKQGVLNAFRTGDVLRLLDNNEALWLIRLLQNKIHGARRKVRGAKVPEELRRSLEKALSDGDYTLSQLEKMFNLSISYISRVKRKMRDKEGYEDRPLEGPEKGHDGIAA